MGLGSRHNFIKKCPCFLICKTGMGVVCSGKGDFMVENFHEVRLSSVHGGGGKPLTSNEA